QGWAAGEVRHDVLAWREGVQEQAVLVERLGLVSMQTYVVEARRAEDAPWMTVTTVQDDLLADVVAIVDAGPTPGDWRIRHDGPCDSGHPVVPERETVKITRWDRL